ncbi:hypothetical protein AAFF_G00267260 [Aldrovandia affinis]|uniref:Centrosomal protein of 85 kDa-like CC4 coiled-coil domain-containing protein n=1 Tax=Aldrovandia affinis TaxID=143900 RepID=A0AAD7W2W5_9TELE|nr:hypothetical protein AAFF_G00267260 [Aldrovandia affinis]
MATDLLINLQQQMLPPSGEAGAEVMPLDPAPLWAWLQLSGCVLLLPALLLLCTCCSKRKSRSVSDGEEAGPVQPSVTWFYSTLFQPVAVKGQGASRSPDPQPQPMELQQTQAEPPAPLPAVSLQKESVRRHSSYTSSNVYDVVAELRCDWPAGTELRCDWPEGTEMKSSRRQTSACSHLYEEVQWRRAEEGATPFPVYAQVHRATPTTPRAPPTTPRAPPTTPRAPPTTPTAPPTTPRAPPTCPTAPPTCPTAPPTSPTAPPTASDNADFHLYAKGDLLQSVPCALCPVPYWRLAPECALCPEPFCRETCSRVSAYPVSPAEALQLCGRVLMMPPPLRWRTSCLCLLTNISLKSSSMADFCCGGGDASESAAVGSDLLCNFHIISQVCACDYSEQFEQFVSVTLGVSVIYEQSQLPALQVCGTGEYYDGLSQTPGLDLPAGHALRLGGMDWQTPALSEKFQSRFGRRPDSTDTGVGSTPSDSTEEFCCPSGSPPFQPIRSQMCIPTAHVMPSTAAAPGAPRPAPCSSPLPKAGSSPSVEAQGGGDCLSRYRSLVNGLDHSLLPPGEQSRFHTPAMEPTLNQSALLGSLLPEPRPRLPAHEPAYKVLPEAPPPQPWLREPQAGSGFDPRWQQLESLRLQVEQMQQQQMAQLEQRLRETELCWGEELLTPTCVCYACRRRSGRSAFLRAQFVERTEGLANEKAEAERRLAAEEAESRRLGEALREADASARRRAEEAGGEGELPTRQEVRSRDKHISSLKKKCQKESEESLEKQQRIETLERYLGDLPTSEHYQSQSKQLEQAQEQVAELQCIVGDMEARLAEARDAALERERELEQQRERERAAHYCHQDRVREGLEDGDRVREGLEDGVRLPSLDVETLQGENSTLREELQRQRKVIEKQQKTMEQMRTQIGGLREQAEQEEGCVQALREELCGKEQDLQRLRSAVKEVTLCSESGADGGEADPAGAFGGVRLGPPPSPAGRLTQRLHTELSACLGDLRSVCNLLTQRAQGHDPNLSLLLGIASPPTGGEEQDDWLQAETLDRKLSEVRQLRRDVEELRTTVSNRYAQDMGDNCTTHCGGGCVPRLRANGAFKGGCVSVCLGPFKPRRGGVGQDIGEEREPLIRAHKGIFSAMGIKLFYTTVTASREVSPAAASRSAPAATCTWPSFGDNCVEEMEGFRADWDTPSSLCDATVARTQITARGMKVSRAPGRKEGLSLVTVSMETCAAENKPGLPSSAVWSGFGQATQAATELRVQTPVSEPQCVNTEACAERINLPRRMCDNVEVKSQQAEMMRILESKSIRFELVDISVGGAVREEMRSKAGNPNAIPPQLFNNDQYCGDAVLNPSQPDQPWSSAPIGAAFGCPPQGRGEGEPARVRREARSVLWFEALCGSVLWCEAVCGCSSPQDYQMFSEAVEEDSVEQFLKLACSTRRVAAVSEGRGHRLYRPMTEPVRRKGLKPGSQEEVRSGVRGQRSGSGRSSRVALGVRPHARSEHSAAPPHASFSVEHNSPCCWNVRGSFESAMLTRLKREATGRINNAALLLSVHRPMGLSPVCRCPTLSAVLTQLANRLREQHPENEAPPPVLRPESQHCDIITGRPGERRSLASVLMTVAGLEEPWREELRRERGSGERGSEVVRGAQRQRGMEERCARRAPPGVACTCATPSPASRFSSRTLRSTRSKFTQKSPPTEAPAESTDQTTPTNVPTTARQRSCPTAGSGVNVRWKKPSEEMLLALAWEAQELSPTVHFLFCPRLFLFCPRLFLWNATECGVLAMAHAPSCRLTSISHTWRWSLRQVCSTSSNRPVPSEQHRQEERSRNELGKELLCGFDSTMGEMQRLKRRAAMVEDRWRVTLREVQELKQSAQLELCKAKLEEKASQGDEVRRVESHNRALKEQVEANSRLLEQLTERGQEKDKLQQALEETRKTADKRKAMLGELAMGVAQEKSRHKEELSDARLQHEKELSPPHSLDRRGCGQYTNLIVDSWLAQEPQYKMGE